MGNERFAKPGLDDAAKVRLLSASLDYLSLPIGIVAESWRQSVDEIGAARANLLRTTIAVYQMSHSWTLLQIASQTAHRGGLNDLYSYFREHADEEKDHLGWGLKDSAVSQKSLGLLESAAFPPPIPEEIYQLVLRQYSSAASLHGLSAFVGYVMALEAFPAKPGTWEDWCKEHGVSEHAAQSPIRHAIADQEHRMELFELIERVPSIDIEAVFEEARSCLFAIAKSMAAKWPN